MRTLLAAALLLTASPAAAELLWPLQQAPEDRALSSSFCEDRGSHLHGGVDMSTGGKVGVPVVAVADGAVVRVKVKYRGLGRAIYLQHDGGLMTVYGHLAGFAEPVRSKIDALIAKRGTYPGDWFPEEPIPVKAGQVIAWSGKTGGGPPHLHFETRRGGGNRPVDPWAEGLPCIDRRPPELHALAVLRRPYLRDELAVLPAEAPLSLDGSELLRLHVADRFGAGTGFVRLLTASLGGEPFYRWDAGSYTYGVTRFAGHAFSRAAPSGSDPSAPGSWVWLNAWPGGALPFVIAPEAGSNRPLGPVGARLVLELRAADGCGNETTASLPVVVARPPADSESGRGDRALDLRSGAMRVRLPAEASQLPPEPGWRLVEDETAAAPPEGLRPIIGPVAIEPAWLPLSRKASVTFVAPPDLERARLGVHRWNPASRAWQFWGDDVGGGSEIGTSTDRLGVFALLEDAFPPRVVSIERRAVKGLPWRDDADELVVRYEERGEGVGWDGIRFRPEGSEEEWVAVHDPDEAEGAFALPKALAGGRVVGTLVLVDGAGHRVEQPVDSSP